MCFKKIKKWFKETFSSEYDGYVPMIRGNVEAVKSPLEERREEAKFSTAEQGVRPMHAGVEVKVSTPKPRKPKARK